VPNKTIPGESSRQTLLDTIGIDWLSDENLDSMVVRRELTAASVAALGDFWDNELDREWQDFAPEVG
jgi:hypothetical protein